MKRCIAVAMVLSLIAILGNAAPASAGVRWGIGINIPLFWPAPCEPCPRYYYPCPPTVVYAPPPPVYYPPSTVYAPQNPPVTYVYPNQAPAPAAVQPAPAPAPAAQTQAPVPTPTPQPVAQPQQPAVQPQQPAAQPVQPAPMVVLDPKAAGYIRMLSQGDDGDRKKAAKELKNFNVVPVLGALVDALQKDGSADVRKEAANSLGSMLARDAQPILRQAAREDSDSGVRKAALKAAQKIEKEFRIQP